MVLGFQQDNYDRERDLYEYRNRDLSGGNWNYSVDICDDNGVAGIAMGNFEKEKVLSVRVHIVILY